MMGNLFEIIQRKTDSPIIDYYYYGIQNRQIWFGTRGNACLYDGKTFTIFKNNNDKAFYNVWSIIEDKKGNIWFGGR